MKCLDNLSRQPEQNTVIIGSAYLLIPMDGTIHVNISRNNSNTHYKHTADTLLRLFIVMRAIFQLHYCEASTK
jgi:hypothetical protein